MQQLTERMTKAEDKIQEHDFSIKRLQSDYESEKGTRVRSNADLTKDIKDVGTRVTNMEKRMYMFLGGLAVISYVIQFVKK